MTNSCCAPNCELVINHPVKRRKRRTRSKARKKMQRKTCQMLSKKTSLKMKRKTSQKMSEKTSPKMPSVPKKISTFGFPKHKTEPERRASWIARVPRENWHPKDDAKIFLCEKHFLPTDIIVTSSDTNSRRKRKKTTEMLTHKRLKDSAMPCIWPGSPLHLSKIPTPRPTSYASSESRSENIQKMQQEAEHKKIDRDIFNSLQELISKEGQLALPNDTQKVISADYVLFYKLAFDDDIPKVKYSVQVSADLITSVCHVNEKLKKSHLDGTITKEMTHAYSVPSSHSIYNF